MNPASAEAATRVPAHAAASEMDAARAIGDEAHALSQAGRFGEALALVSRELARSPKDPELIFARASTLFDWGRLREAREAYLEAEALGLARTALFLNLAWASHLLRRSEDAERYASRAVESDPGSGPAYMGLATARQRLKRYPEAIAAYEQALERTPEFSSCAAGIAFCKLEQRDYADAEVWLRKAIALEPEGAQLWTNLGVALASMDRFDEAFEALRRAEALEAAQGLPPESALSYAFTLILTGQDAAAVELLRRHLPKLPDPRMHSHYAFALLTLGDYREGWDQYEVRWLQEPHLSHRPKYAKPVWSGQPLAGKTILLRAEQGAGDIAQFARYAVPLKARGARVVLEVRQGLVELARGFAGVDEAFAPPTSPPPFDYYVHIMGLPRAFGTELATIPAEVPYLRVDPDLWHHWASRIGNRGFRVGVAWAGNPMHPRDRFRSMAISELRPLWEVAGVDFYSLQKAPKEGEIESVPAHARLTDLGPELSDFATTAAAIAQMDLVVCVDTAVAHLAGALGKPVWLLIPKIGDFRWLTEGEDTAWYPTMRLFRQSRLGEWGEVVERVKHALAEAVESGVVTVPAPRAVARSAPSFGTAAQGPIARVAETRHGIMQYLPDTDACARSIALYGEFLEPQLALLARLVAPGACVIEAGAGIGAHALPLARHVGAAGHLILYEQRPVVQKILAQNLDANRLAECVTVMRRPLAGSRDGGDGGEVDTVDDLLLARLDLLKIGPDLDAQAILAGASQTLWRLRPLLFIAAPDAEATVALAVRAGEFGYRCWRMRTPLRSPANFNCRDEDLEGAGVAWALLAIPEEVDVAVALDDCAEIRGTEADPNGERAGNDAKSKGSRVLRGLKKWLR